MTIFTPLRAASAGLAFITTGLMPDPALADIIHADDVIINDSVSLPGTTGVCIGIGCVDGEVFNNSLLTLKGLTPRISFIDTSSSSISGSRSTRRTQEGRNPVPASSSSCSGSLILLS